jgi:Uma2 family endonuclease
MATVTKKLLTAGEFAQLPEPQDGSQQELVRGEIVTMPPPGGMHGGCCSKVDRRLGVFVEDKQLGHVTANDAGFITERDPDTVRGPDIAYWSRQRLPELPVGYIEIPPDLAVEVVSPSDHFSRVQSKVREYLSRGVALVWVVDPEGRTVAVYRSRQQAAILEENDLLSAEDVLPGFQCLVRELLP